MSVKYGKFELPQNLKVDKDSLSKTFTRFIAEPFEKGFGHTLGNFLRRVLLSSLESPAVVSLRLEGVSHEYMAIDGIIEDMSDIILNMKGSLIRKLPTEDHSSSREFRMVSSVIEVSQSDLDKNDGQMEIKLADIFKDGNFEVVNPNMHVLTVTKPLKKQIDLRIGFGRGYVPSERHVIFDQTTDEIIIDTSFSPVSLVNYYVENTRVGQDTDFDKLIIEVTTDGRITPTEALNFAAQIGVKHFECFESIQADKLIFEDGAEIGDSDYDEMMEKLCKRIDEIELSVRSTNCLSGANIATIAELVTIPERKMLEFRNFGKKSLNEIKDKLEEMELSLGMDLTKYGINHDNVEQKIADYLEAKGDLTTEEL